MATKHLTIFYAHNLFSHKLDNLIYSPLVSNEAKKYVITQIDLVNRVNMTNIAKPPYWHASVPTLNLIKYSENQQRKPHKYHLDRKVLPEQNKPQPLRHFVLFVQLSTKHKFD